MGKSRVAIVIPTYNGSQFIKKTIESCLMQSYLNIEIIVIDDASTDNTLEEISFFKDKIKIIKNKANLGLVKTINKALKNITADFVLLLGHDDFLPQEHVSIMLEKFSDINVVAVHCNSILVDKNDDEISIARDDAEQMRKNDNIMYELSIDNFISSCGMMHRKDAFDKVNGWDENYRNYGEWLFYIKELEFGQIKYTTKTKAYYRRHDTNITNTFKTKKVKKDLAKYKRVCRRLAHIKNENSFYENCIYYYNELKIVLKSVLYV